MIRILWIECLLGKSLYRSLHNLSLVGTKLVGRTIDLGSKNGTSSYYRFLQAEDVTYVDYYEGGENVVRVDLEQTLPLGSQTYDNVILFNTLEHIQNSQGLLAESFRITNLGGGSMVLSLFFIHIMPIHMITFATRMNH
jgi:SAM-dependent methyltransferase